MCGSMHGGLTMLTSIPPVHVGKYHTVMEEETGGSALAKTHPLAHAKVPTAHTIFFETAPAVLFFFKSNKDPIGHL